MSMMSGFESKAPGHRETIRKICRGLLHSSDENVLHLIADNDLTTFMHEEENKKKKKTECGRVRQTDRGVRFITIKEDFSS